MTAHNHALALQRRARRLCLDAKTLEQRLCAVSALEDATAALYVRRDWERDGLIAAAEDRLERARTTP